MAQAFASIDIAAPADRVWQLIGGFNSLPDWLPYIPSSDTTEGGRVRHLANPNGESIVERLEKFDNAARSYSYSILRAPFPITDYLATLSVHETAGGCRAEWSATFTPKGVSDEEASQLFKGIFEDGLKALASRFAPIAYRTARIDGLDIFYREAGPKDAPAILLLHGFPTSSHMFRNLIPALADKFHVVAPDYPGFGNSSAPSVAEFEYTFDGLARVIEKLTEKVGLGKYSIYLMDYGAPIGFRLATAHPERVQSLIVQNGNAYEEGIAHDFWKPAKAYWKDRGKENTDIMRTQLTLDATKWQYTHGVRNLETISPDTWHHDQPLLDRPGNQEIQLALLYSYGSNPPLYPKWQEYLRDDQPPTLVVWGKNDPIFPPAGAYPYQRDLKEVDFHLFDTGHFALEEDGIEIASLIRGFLERQTSK